MNTKSQPVRCPVKLRNNGSCPLHNLHCGWPKCNEPATEAQAACPPMPDQIESWAQDAEDHGSQMVPVHRDTLRKIAAALRTTPAVPSAGQKVVWDVFFVRPGMASEDVLTVAKMEDAEKQVHAALIRRIVPRFIDPAKRD